MLKRAAVIVCAWGLVACAGGEGELPHDAGAPDVRVPDAAPADAAPPACATCTVSFSFPAAGASTCELRGNFAPDGWTHGVAMTRVGDHFAASLELPHGRTVQYKFVVDGDEWVADPAAEQVADGVGGHNAARVVDCGCAELRFDWRDAIMYFVLVDRFADGDHANDAPLVGVEPPANFAGGDLAGLRAKIDEGYFDQLGVNVLWISAPIDGADASGLGDDGHAYSSYHGYWPRDLDAVEARVGDLAQLIAVVDAAHRRGLRVVMDYVMNHVHVESPVYAQHPEWFWPLAKDGHECVCGAGCGWEAPDGLRCWFRSYLPDFDFRNPAARDFSVGNAIGWIQRAGVDGFRLDAVKHIESAWITDLRARVASEVEFGDKRFYLVGETFSGDKNLLRAFVDPARMLDGQFDFPLRAELVRVLLERQGSMQDLAGFLAGNDGFYGAGARMGTFLGNHDLPRAIHLAEDAPLFGEWDGGKARAWNDRPVQPSARAPYERLALGFALLMTLPGVPLVYYGDEVGLAGAGDPDNRRPMPWSGLSADQEWLRQRVARLAHLRAQHAALRRGTRADLGASNDALVYQMSSEDETVIVALNRADVEASAPGLPSGTYRELITGSEITTPVKIPARGVMVLVAR
jgi:glycosidase